MKIIDCEYDNNMNPISVTCEDDCEIFIFKRPVSGRWLEGRCTVCGWEVPDSIMYDGYEIQSWDYTPFCPECGAKMS